MALQGKLYKVGYRATFQLKEAQGCVWFVMWTNRQAPITVQDDGFRTSWSEESWNVDGEVFFPMVRDGQGRLYLLEKDQHVWVKRDGTSMSE